MSEKLLSRECSGRVDWLGYQIYYNEVGLAVCEIQGPLLPADVPIQGYACFTPGKCTWKYTDDLGNVQQASGGPLLASEFHEVRVLEVRVTDALELIKKDVFPKVIIVRPRGAFLDFQISPCQDIHLKERTCGVSVQRPGYRVIVSGTEGIELHEVQGLIEHHYERKLNRSSINGQ